MPDPDLSERALETAFRVHRDLNGPSRKPPVLDGLSLAAARVSLPPPVVGLDAALGGALASRRSWYRFGVEQPSAEQMSSLLGWALGPQREVTLPGGGRRMSMAPSAGVCRRWWRI
ncbi:hypothetical protein ABZS66_35930 [Dactylosporangium sp. NPDC005572]|uniref:hypothetical protein n=1 Tax=Dactylosporangium sp. NPDC005572 TaxID=3156889 RepID=UPI0033B20747